MMEGTPKDLAEALSRAQLAGASSHLIMKDFFAQRFGVSLLKAKTPEEQKLIMDLFHSIFPKPE